jgi:hypothetical protein
MTVADAGVITGPWSPQNRARAGFHRISERRASAKSRRFFPSANRFPPSSPGVSHNYLVKVSPAWRSFRLLNWYNPLIAQAGANPAGALNPRMIEGHTFALAGNFSKCPRVGRHHLSRPTSRRTFFAGSSRRRPCRASWPGDDRLRKECLRLGHIREWSPWIPGR